MPFKYVKYDQSIQYENDALLQQVDDNRPPPPQLEVLFRSIHKNK